MRAFIIPAVTLLLTTSPVLAQDQRPNTVCQEGTASYFRAGEGGNTRTASGEPVKPQEHTAASRDLPFGTIATITNQRTGQSTEVRVTDRGPERTDRVIDVSEVAARDLGMEDTGIAPVTIQADPAQQTDPAVRERLEEMAKASQPC